MSHPVSDLARLLQAIQFSAEKHRHQRRKDHYASPYINHPVAVANLLATVGGVTDIATLMAAILHDTVEDTETAPGDIEAEFGGEVRRLVEEVTDDMRLPKEERKRLQIVHAPMLSPQARLIKLADKIGNVEDIAHFPPKDWSTDRRQHYLDWAEQVVAGCRGVNAALERRFDDALQHTRSVLKGPD